MYHLQIGAGICFVPTTNTVATDGVNCCNYIVITMVNIIIIVKRL